uniref:Sodium channel protein n=1 Tax=Ciona intestinalis TaxID=7719 RepID=F7AUQ0_CIOIN
PYFQTYIVVNDQGSIFRFSKAESLFLFGQESRLRNAAINLFIKPMFSNFIMLVILFNCACMVLENPPHWVDDYLEYVFTAIYIAEATVKITARGFVLHSFSYLRDPWNWLDFIVIVSALATEILKAIVRSTMLGQIAVLRTFRVLRALKTMSVVPGLRGIVKALLRSIHALKDAVALTVFCVSVFALIGYQLFHGTLRQKFFDNGERNNNKITRIMELGAKIQSLKHEISYIYSITYSISMFSDMCPLGYGCYEAGGNPDYGYTSFDHFFLAFLTSFRLVALDSWSRLYYLTLHTIGKTYAIFYIVVVLLGSYYLVNLILAVVYMAYEEQQAVVEEEELEAKEREAEKREQERAYTIDATSSDTCTCSDDSSMYQHGDMQRPKRRRSLSKSRRRRYRRKSPVNLKSLEENKKDKHEDKPSIRLIVTEIESEAESGHRMLKNKQENHHEKNANFLSVNEALRRGRMSSLSSETSSCCCNSKFSSTEFSFRRLSDSSSMWGDNESEQGLYFPERTQERRQRQLCELAHYPIIQRFKLKLILSSTIIGMGPAEYFQTNNNLLSPVNPSPVKTTGDPAADDINIDEDQTIAVISEDDISPTSRRARWKLKNKKMTDRYQKFSRAFVNLFCKWRCCPAGWSKIQRKVRRIVLNPFTDLLITLCIALNTLFMSLEQHPMEAWFAKILDNANVFFTIVFTVEMLMKIIGLSPYTYFNERWNVFDAVVVLFSLLELLLNSTQGLSVFRAFRLMRILKLAKQWPTLNKLLRIIGKTLGQLWHLTLVLFLVLFIFAVVGMQLLRESYISHYLEHNQGKLPRWNFIDFPHSFMVVFRIQCGEWVENMFTCLNVAPPGICIPLFILVYIIGNLVILNLFLALLLNSFSGDVLQQTEPSKSRNDSVCAIVQESNDLLNNPNKETCKEKRSRSVTPEGRCSSRVSRRRNSMTSRASESSSIPLSPTSSSHRRRKASVSARDRYRGIRSSVGEGSGGEGIKENGREDKLTNKNHVRRVSRRFGILAMQNLNQVQDEDKTESVEEENEVNETENEKTPNSRDGLKDCLIQHTINSPTFPFLKFQSKLQPCFSCWTREPLSGPWFEMREFMHKIIIHRYFENIVIFCILLSTVTLAMEDIHIDKRPAMKKVVHIIDIFCCIFFTVEMLMKWIGKGLRSYFTNPWCCLDFFIVLVSLVNIFMASNQRADFSALRALRTFRALRPLRALSRFQGMKIVVDALIRAVPSITHVFFICMIFWLIFSILGVNIFGGRFGRCVSLMTGDIMLLPIIRNRTECELCANMMNTTLINWQIPSVNFDSAPRGLLALLQIATFTGWIEIMGSAIDITGIESQPRYENSFYNYLYFCVFIIFGAFFSLNLFIGVIIDNFNQQKIKTKGGEDGVFLTDEQRRYYNAMKRMASKTPKKPIPRPNSRFANKIYDIVTDRKFEIAVMGLIMLNLVVMAIEHHDMSPEMYKLLQNFNLGFICVFLLEAILKLIGLRLYYFTVPWNVFDILVVVVSLIASGLHDVMTQYFVQPTIFRIIRLFRVTRILRLIREAKGIRTLLFALMMSLPALFNIGSLLFLLMFIYAIIGMSQFPYIQKVAGVDDLLNFETFPNAFLVLFQISTSEGWDTFIDPVLRDREPYCDESPADGSPSNCGNATVGVIYFVTYVMITFLIVVNMYIAIILENFEVATRESAEPLTADDFEQFFEVWQRFDDRLTQFVTYEQLKLLLHQLDFPLRVALPNTAFISQAHMKVTLDGRIHCLEVIITLIKKVLGDSPELNNLKDSMLQSFKLKCPAKESLEDQETIDSEEFTVQLRAVIIIQRAYREYR